MREVGQGALGAVLLEGERVAQREGGLEGGAERRAEGYRRGCVPLPLLIAEPMDGVPHVVRSDGDDIEGEAEEEWTERRIHIH